MTPHLLCFALSVGLLVQYTIKIPLLCGVMQGTGWKNWGIEGLKDWRIEGLKNWGIEGLKDWRIEELLINILASLSLCTTATFGFLTVARYRNSLSDRSDTNFPDLLRAWQDLSNFWWGSFLLNKKAVPFLIPYHQTTCLSQYRPKANSEVNGTDIQSNIFRWFPAVGLLSLPRIKKLKSDIACPLSSYIMPVPLTLLYFMFSLITIRKLLGASYVGWISPLFKGATVGIV